MGAAHIAAVFTSVAAAANAPNLLNVAYRCFIMNRPLCTGPETCYTV
jgi:hypothetical protein